ncbi:hypothetical protein I6F38_06725 [Bradyrhizobium sp. BRP56]|nr:hypothetical protein [Bradyrhizobium sp. BRP56]
MAGDALDKVTDSTASQDDQASRKRKLIKGPEAFHKMRRDRKMIAASRSLPIIGSKAGSAR